MPDPAQTVEEDADLPHSDLTAADLTPGELVRASFGRRAGVVTRVDVDDDKVWIRQVSTKDRGYVLEERLCRAEWLDKLTSAEPWTHARAYGETVPFVDYAGWPRVGQVIDVDGIFVRLQFRIGTGASRELWVDRYIPQDPRRP